MSTTIEATDVQIEDLTVDLWEWQGKTTKGWTYEDIETVVERVNRGAALLDEEKPGWVEAVLPSKLDMSGADFCIIGQVYGRYSEYHGIPFGMGINADAPAEAIQHGFLTQLDGDEFEDGEVVPDKLSIPYALLDRVWVYMLTERQKRDASVTLSLPSERPPGFNMLIQRLVASSLLRDEDGRFVETDAA